jgi:F-type H+-transporting ATPase subunit epsilon
MYLEIITPETRLFEGEVSSVTFPGEKGSFQVLNNHAPIISLLQEGRIQIRMADNTSKIDPSSGQVVLDTSDDKLAIVEIVRGVVELRNNNMIVLVNK